MRLFKNLLSLALLFVGIRYAGAEELKNSDFERFSQNLIDYYTDDLKYDVELSAKVISSITDEGSWEGLDYASQARSGWDPIEHAKNMLTMATAYNKPGSPYYHKKDVAELFRAAIYQWVRTNPSSPNWWQQEIGTPLYMAPAIIMMQSTLSSDDLQAIFPVLNVPKIGMTGQNRVWLAGNVFFRGIIYKNFEEIAAGVEVIEKEIRMAKNEEGIQPDFSFHQHGAQQQFGNYGRSFLVDMIKWAKIFDGTPYRFDDAQLAILRNYILEGQQWVLWKNMMDIHALGRQNEHDVVFERYNSVIRNCKILSTVDREHKRDYDKMVDYRNLVGHKHFWCSDYPIKRTKEYMFSVRMCSSRVIGSESCNHEHLKGYYSGDGVALLYQSGNEYLNIAPCWNWRKQPGVTLAQNDSKFKLLGYLGYTIDSDFVGGVSNGECGIAAMRYIREGVNADKSWFMFDDMIICLGSGVGSTTNDEITTSLNQVISNGEVVTSAGELAGTLSSDDISWVWHDDVGYLFPNGGAVHATQEDVTGSWDKISRKLPKDEITENIFTLWLSHGTKPVDDTYAYVMLPNASLKRTKSYSHKLPYVLTNSRDLQVVEAKNGKVGGAVVYKAGDVNLLGGITISEPAIVMYEKSRKGVKLYVSDPTRKLTSLTLTLSGDYTIDGKRTVNVELPKGDNAGSTLELQLQRR